MIRYFLSSTTYGDLGFCWFLKNHITEELKNVISKNFTEDEIKNIKFTVKVVETSSGMYAVFYNSHALVLSDRGSPTSRVNPKRFLTRFFQQYSKKIRRFYRLYVSI